VDTVTIDASGDRIIASGEPLPVRSGLVLRKLLAVTGAARFRDIGALQLDPRPGAMTIGTRQTGLYMDVRGELFNGHGGQCKRE
jgi:hypothetical protein